MAKLPDTFKQAQSSDEALPAGDYLVECTKTELKDTKNGDGKYIAFSFKILEGKSKDSVLFMNLNIVNPNEAAVRIAKATLNKFAKSVGKDPDKLEDTDELLHVPVIATVSKRPDDDAYPGNDIKGFKKASTSGAAPKKNPFAK